MSMTRDTYAREVKRVAEAALFRNENVRCPHEECTQNLNVVRQSMYSTRSLFCPTHGLIFQEQESEPYGKLDWEAASIRAKEMEELEEEEAENQEEI